MLSILSKVLEKVISKRIVSFFEGQNILTHAQYTYRFGKSAIIPLAESIEEIMRAHDHQEYVEMMLCDMSRAFNTVQHDLLLAKLDYFGLRDKTNRQLKPDLRDRTEVAHWKDPTLAKDQYVVVSLLDQFYAQSFSLYTYINNFSQNISHPKVY